MARRPSLNLARIWRIMIFMNTLHKGRFRWIIFKDGKDWIGTALEFNITVTGEDPRVVEVELNEAVQGHLDAARKLKGIRTHQVQALLNQDAEAEYEERWKAARESMRGNVPSPLANDIYRFGVANLAIA